MGEVVQLKKNGQKEPPKQPTPEDAIIYFTNDVGQAVMRYFGKKCENCGSQEVTDCTFKNPPPFIQIDTIKHLIKINKRNHVGHTCIWRPN